MHLLMCEELIDFCEEIDNGKFLEENMREPRETNNIA